MGDKQGFWSDPLAPEPKRAYRWLMYLGNSLVPQWVVKSVSKPSFTVSETEHKFLNHTFWYPGKVAWNAVEVTLVDPVTPDASLLVMDILARSGYGFPTTLNNASFTITKANATAAMGSVKIEQIGVNKDDVLDAFVLKNAWVQDAKFGDLSYESDDMVEISLTLRYDWAEITAFK